MKKEIELEEAIKHCDDVISNLKQKGNCNECLKQHEQLKKWLISYKELLDKETPKKPDYEGDGYDEKGEIIYDTWICPNCGKRYEVDYDDYDYCPNCGQKIDWSENNE